MDPVFRGCTRPALIFGIPIVPLVVVLLPLALVGVWISLWVNLLAWIWLLAIGLPVVFTLRSVTTLDDQRLLQLLLLAQLLAARGPPLCILQRAYAPQDYRAGSSHG